MNKEFSQKLQDMVKISEILDRHGDSVGSAAVLLSAFGMVEKETYRLADELDSMTKTASTEARVVKQEEMRKMAGIGQWLAKLVGKSGIGLGKWLGKAPSELALTRGLTGIGEEGAGKVLRSGLNKLKGKTPQLENAFRELALTQNPAKAAQLAAQFPGISPEILQTIGNTKMTQQQLLNYLGSKGLTPESLGFTKAGLSNIAKGIGTAGLGLAGAGALSSMGNPNTPPYQPTTGIPSLTPGMGGLGTGMGGGMAPGGGMGGGMAPGGGYGGGMSGGEIAAIQSAIGTLDQRVRIIERKVGLA
jgi:hypothetical protein